MNASKFIKQVRQYARFARLRHRSFAHEVSLLYSEHIKWVMSQDVSDDVRSDMLATAEDFLLREYGEFDTKFELPEVQ